MQSNENITTRHIFFYLFIEWLVTMKFLFFSLFMILKLHVHIKKTDKWFLKLDVLSLKVVSTIFGTQGSLQSNNFQSHAFVIILIHRNTYNQVKNSNKKPFFFLYQWPATLPYELNLFFKISCYFNSFQPYSMSQTSIQCNFSFPPIFIMNSNLNLMKNSMEI